MMIDLFPDPGTPLSGGFRSAQGVRLETRTLATVGDNHDVIAADGRVADIGLFRGAGAFLISLVERQSPRDAISRAGARRLAPWMVKEGVKRMRAQKAQKRGVERRKKLAPEQREQLLRTLKARFEKNMKPVPTTTKIDNLLSVAGAAPCS